MSLHSSRGSGRRERGTLPRWNVRTVVSQPPDHKDSRPQGRRRGSIVRSHCRTPAFLFVFELEFHASVSAHSGVKCVIWGFSHSSIRASLLFAPVARLRLVQPNNLTTDRWIDIWGFQIPPSKWLSRTYQTASVRLPSSVYFVSVVKKASHQSRQWVHTIPAFH